jgi:hypothetical protein
MQQRFIVLLGAAALFACLGSPALAWNRAGHMVTAAIAYRDLKTSEPVVLEKTVALLKRHPHYQKQWLPRLQKVAPEDRDLLLFMLVARWPDDIRGDGNFDRPKQHYIDFAFVPQSAPATVRGAEPEADNLVASFQKNRDLVAGNDCDDQRAVALAWLFHQVGDIHQPLHAVSLFTTDYPAPEGDQGGTRFYIRAKEGADTISLHRLWDDFVIGSENITDVRNRATELALQPEFARSSFAELPAANVRDWAQESFDLARSVVYRQGRLNGSKDRMNGVLLPADYLKQAQPIGRRRAVLSAYRLADLVKQVIH